MPIVFIVASTAAFRAVRPALFAGFRIHRPQADPPARLTDRL